jgi:hypothetical protein
MDKTLHKRVMVTSSKGNLRIAPTVTENAKSFCDEINVTDECTSSENCLKNC